MTQNLKALTMMMTGIVAAIAIGASVFAWVDSTDSAKHAIATHDTCETAHPMLRAQVNSLQTTVNQIKTTSDSLLIEQRHFQEKVRFADSIMTSDLREIKRLLKNLDGATP